MLEERLAVIGQDDHQRILGKPQVLKKPKDFADVLVGVGDFPIVESHHVRQVHDGDKLL